MRHAPLCELERDQPSGTGDVGSLVANGWYLLFTVKRPAWCSSRALMKESSEPQLKGEGGGEGGSGEGLRTPVGAVRNFTVEEVFGTWRLGTLCRRV